MVTQEQIIAIINAELTKRGKAYPKSVKKLRDEGEPESKVDALIRLLRTQSDKLISAKLIIDGCPSLYAPNAILAELNREMDMRRKVYRHYVAKKWMTQEKADKGLSEWQAVIDYFILIHE